MREMNFLCNMVTSSFWVFVILNGNNDRRQADAQFQPQRPPIQPQQQLQPQQAIISCFNNPCKNGARCVNSPQGQSGNGYTCLCVPPWSGINCDQQQPQQQQSQFSVNNNQNQQVTPVPPNGANHMGKQLIGVQPGFYTMFTQPIYNTNIANAWNIEQSNKPQPQAQNPGAASYQGGGGMPLFNNPGYRPTPSIYGGYGGYGQQQQQQPLLPNFNNPYGNRPTPPGFGQGWGGQYGGGQYGGSGGQYGGGQYGGGQYGYGCQSMPCKNDATCMPDAGPMGYRCLCIDDYDGFNCENYHLSRGAKLGIILGTVIPGVIILVVVVCILVYFFVIRPKRLLNQQQKQQQRFPPPPFSNSNSNKKVSYKNVAQNDV